MKWIGSFSRRKLPQAQPQPLAAGLSAETCTQTAETRMLAGLIKDGIVDIRHPQKGKRSGAEALAIGRQGRASFVALYPGWLVRSDR